MQTPKMILFDYGHTLCYEAGADFLRGERAVFEHVVANPHRVTPEEACALGTKLFADAESVRRSGYEVHEWPLLRLKYESLGLRFDLPMEELEIVLADAAAPDRLMPGVEAMLADLRSHGIRTGVISNLGWSGHALEERLNKMLPEHQFEFILASSEYALRKPNPLLFRVALEKAELPASEVWYIGDSLSADVAGARNAGLFPVLYADDTVPNPWAAKDTGLTADCLTIRHWSGLTDLLTKGADDPCPTR